MSFFLSFISSPPPPPEFVKGGKVVWGGGGVEGGRERESVCVCVCERERERERERESERVLYFKRCWRAMTEQRFQVSLSGEGVFAEIRHGACWRPQTTRLIGTMICSRRGRNSNNYDENETRVASLEDDVMSRL